MNWQPNTTYHPGDVVIHNGVLYTKLDDGDNSAPDAVAGGWESAGSPELDNLDEFLAIKNSFASYVEQSAKYQAKLQADRTSAEEKLHRLGLTADEVTALLT